jgi:hypothetical protein
VVSEEVEHRLGEPLPLELLPLELLPLELLPLELSQLRFAFSCVLESEYPNDWHRWEV